MSAKPSAPVICPNCGADIPAEDINITALVAKCAGCDHISKLPDLGGGASGRPDRSEPPKQPSRVTLGAARSGELVIERSWFEPTLFGLLFFCVFWDGFLVFWYSVALFGREEKEFEWMAVLFPIGHIAVGVGLTYYVAAGFLNKTRVTIDHRFLTVKKGPVPWRGNRQVHRDDIVGFEVDYTHANNKSPRYSLSAHRQDGDLTVLMSGLDLGQVDFLCYCLADFLEVEEVWRVESQSARVSGRAQKYLPKKR